MINEHGAYIRETEHSGITLGFFVGLSEKLIVGDAEYRREKKTGRKLLSFSFSLNFVFEMLTRH